MKASLSAVLLGFAVASFGVPVTAQGAQDEAAMRDCFRKHGNLMDKPAMRNMRACWRAHGYLMQRSKAVLQPG